MVASSQKLPPSGRDFEVYRLLHVDGISTREAAQAMRLSQTRICQIAEKVVDYVNEVAPAKENDRREQRLFVAENVAAMRVTALYGSAMQAWRASQGEVTTTRQLEGPMQAGVKVHTTRQSAGDGRYLMVAARLAMIASRLPAASLSLCAADEVEDGKEEVESIAAASHPLDGDCSDLNSEQGNGECFSTNDQVVSRLADEVYQHTPRPAVKARREFFAPVQMEDLDAPDEELLSFAPAESSPPLSRQQRRARQKMLERKLRKAK